MAFVVTKNCLGVKCRNCEEVCPVDCFLDNADASLNERFQIAAKNGDTGLLVINPKECLHCGACSVECPVDAIFPDDDIPMELSVFIGINREASQKLEK